MAVFQGLVDFHTHFFGAGLLERVGAATPGARQAAAGGGSAALDLELHRQRWLEEMAEHGLAHLGSFADLPGEVEPLTEAAQGSDGRLLVFARLDPTAAGAREQAELLLARRGVRGLVLTPALDGYRVDAPAADPVLELAATLGAPVVVHCGLLPPRLRDLPGSRPLDLRLGDPLALVPVADRHPRLRLVVPRFGGGFLRETLLAGEAAPNILVDSSSDHSWLRTQPAELRLEDLLERVLGVFGPERLLFATGSSILPRGWRHERFTHQREALGALGVGAADQAAIFRDNARRLLDL